MDHATHSKEPSTTTCNTPILVSACLIGEPCRYDGKAYPCEGVERLAQTHTLIPVCPEQMGGLPTPRACTELQADGRAVDAQGADRTEAFMQGARDAVRVAKQHGCKQAILKSKSPSCGTSLIYDGTFTGTLIPGRGITAQALAKAGIELLSEDDFAPVRG